MKKIAILVGLFLSFKSSFAQTAKVICENASNQCPSQTQSCFEDFDYVPDGSTCKKSTSSCVNSGDCCSGLCMEDKTCDVTRTCAECIPDGKKIVEGKKCCSGTFMFEDYCLKELPPPTDPLYEIVFKKQECGSQVDKSPDNVRKITDLRTSQNNFYAFEFLFMGLYEKIHRLKSRNVYLSYFNYIGDLFEVAKMIFIGRIGRAMALKSRMEKLNKFHADYVNMMKTNTDFNKSAFVTNDSLVLELQKNYIQESYYAAVGSVFALISPIFKIIRESIRDFYAGRGFMDRIHHIWNPGGGLPHPICSYQPGIIWRGHEMCSARVVAFDKTITTVSNKNFRILVDPIDPSWPLSVDSEKVMPEFSSITDCSNHDSLLRNPILNTNVSSKIDPMDRGIIEFCHHRGNPVWSTIKKALESNSQMTNPYEYFKSTQDKENFIPFIALIIEKKPKNFPLVGGEILVHPIFCKATDQEICMYSASNGKVFVNTAQDIEKVKGKMIIDDDIFNFEPSIKKLNDSSYKWFNWYWRNANNVREGSRRYYMAANRNTPFTSGLENQVERGILVNVEEANLEKIITDALNDYADKHSFIFKEDGDKNSDRTQSAQIAYELFFQLADPSDKVWSEASASNSPLQQNPYKLNFDLPWYLFFDDMSIMPHFGFFRNSGLFLSEVLDEFEQRSIHLAKQYGAFKNMYTENGGCANQMLSEVNVNNNKGVRYSGETGSNNLSNTMISKNQNAISPLASNTSNSNASSENITKEGFNIDTQSSNINSTGTQNVFNSSQASQEGQNKYGLDEKSMKNLAIAQQDLVDRTNSFKKNYSPSVVADIQNKLNTNFANKSNLLATNLKGNTSFSPMEDTTQIPQSNSDTVNSEEKTIPQNKPEEKKSQVIDNNNTNNGNSSSIVIGNSSSGSNTNENINNKEKEIPVIPTQQLNEVEKLRQINNDESKSLFDVISTSYVRFGIKRLKTGSREDNLPRSQK